MLKIVLCIMPLLMFVAEYVFIRKYDKETPLLNVKIKDFAMPFCFWLIGDYLIIKTTPVLNMLAISIIVGYLTFQSLCDRKGKKVYCVFNYIAIIWGILTDIHWIVSGHSEFEIKQKAIVLSAVCVFLLIGKIGRLYGSGDGEVVFALATILLPVSLITARSFLVGMCVGATFLIVLRLYDIIKAKVKGITLEKGIAMVPGITLGLLVAIGLK